MIPPPSLAVCWTQPSCSIQYNTYDEILGCGGLAGREPSPLDPFLRVSVVYPFFIPLLSPVGSNTWNPRRDLAFWKPVLHPKSGDLVCLYWNASRFWPHRLMQTLEFGELKSRREMGVEEWKSNFRLSTKSKLKLWGFKNKLKKKKSRKVMWANPNPTLFPWLLPYGRHPQTTT